MRIDFHVRSHATHSWNIFPSSFRKFRCFEKWNYAEPKRHSSWGIKLIGSIMIMTGIVVVGQIESWADRHTIETATSPRPLIQLYLSWVLIVPGDLCAHTTIHRGNIIQFSRYFLPASSVLVGIRKISSLAVFCCFRLIIIQLLTIRRGILELYCCFFSELSCWTLSAVEQWENIFKSVFFRTSSSSHRFT